MAEDEAAHEEAGEGDAVVECRRVFLHDPRSADGEEDDISGLV
jgi:hypothetical protein